MMARRNALLELLAARAWTDGMLARRSGVARSHLNEIKNSRIVPRVSTALRIARAFDLPVAAVFPPGSGCRRPRHARGRAGATAYIMSPFMRT